MDKKWIAVALAVPIGALIYWLLKKPQVKVIIGANNLPNARLTVYNAPPGYSDNDLRYLAWTVNRSQYVLMTNQGIIIGDTLEGAKGFANSQGATISAAYYAGFKYVDPSIPSAELIFTPVPL